VDVGKRSDLPTTRAAHVSLDVVLRSAASGYFRLPNNALLRDCTGQSYSCAGLVLSESGVIAAATPPATTPDAELRMALLSTIFGSHGQRQPITSSRLIRLRGDQQHAVVLDAWAAVEGLPLVMLRPTTRMHRANRKSAAPPMLQSRIDIPAGGPAEELRSISGLPPMLLAELFDVSRTTIYKWLNGVTPRGRHFEHLTQALAHIKDASRQFVRPAELATWLRSPIAAGASRPMDYLRLRRFSTFRGLLIGIRSGDVGLTSPIPLPLTTSRLTRAEFRLAGERLRPSPAIEDDMPSPADEA
jgi:hypothetical protein